MITKEKALAEGKVLQEDDLDIIEERISRCIDYFNEF